MMDWVMGAYSGIKAATDITQSMLTLKTDAAVTSKVIELNGVLLGLQGQLNSAHTEHTVLGNRIRDLEAEIAKFVSWEHEKTRYDLHQFEIGTFAYKVKAEVIGAAPAYCICANCYEKGVKALLQACKDGYYNALKCHNCDSLIRTDLPPRSGPRVIKSRDSFRGY